MSSYEPMEDSDQASARNNPIQCFHETDLYGTETSVKGDGNLLSKISGLRIGLDFDKHEFTKDRSRGTSEHRKLYFSDNEHKRKPSVKPEADGDIQTKLYNACITGNLRVVKDILDKHYTTLKPDEEGQTPLFAACIGNQPEIVKYLIHRGYDVNHQDNHGKTPLHVAYEWEEFNIVKLLLTEFKPSLSLRDSRQWTPCHVSIDTGHYSISPSLIKKFFETDVGTDVAWIQLHAACYAGDLEKIKVLLATGVDIHHASSVGYTALHVACTENQPEVVRFLLEHGANNDIQLSVNIGLFPLHMACAKAGTRIIQDLLEYGADPNATSKEVTATHLAVESGNYHAVHCMAAWPTTDLNAVDKDGDTCLHRAVAKRNLDIVTVLLQKDLNVNCLDYRCLTPLHIAIHQNESSIVEKLLAAKADPNIRDVEGNTSLLLALLGKRWNMIEMLLAAGANVEATDSDGDSALHVAVAKHCGLQTVKMLLQYKAAVNSVNHNLQTPLLKACLKYEKEVIDLLLNTGADPKLADKFGQTCLHWVVTHKDCDSSIVKVLMEHGAQIDATDYKSRTALHCACSARCWGNIMTLLNAGADPNIQDSDGDNLLHNAVHKSCRPDILQALIVHDVSINAQNNFLLTPLHLACMDRQTRTVKVLLESGADPNVTDDYGNTPLHLVAYHGCDREMVQHLVRHGAEVNMLNNQSETAVLLAYSREHTDSASELLKFSADPNVSDGKGQTCLQWAVHKRCKKEVLQELIDNGADPNTLDHRHRTALLLACCRKDLSAIDVLLKAGANPNITDADGSTILHMAVHQYLSAQTLQTLIDHGAQVDALDEKQGTALLLTCMSEQVQSARVLLKNGANADLGSVPGSRCLHEAVIKGNAELVELLVSHPLDINAVNEKHQTALYMACAAGQRNIARILIDQGADLNIRNRLQNTALHIAIKQDTIDLIGDLLEHGADVNIQGQHAMTPLHTAIAYKSESCMQMLLKHKPDLNIQDKGGKTPLIATCKKGLHTLAVLLLQQGAETHIVDTHGRCAFYYAVEEGKQAMMKILIDHDPSVLNTVIGGKETALHYFCRKGRADMVEWLVSRGADKDKNCGNQSPLDVAHKNGHKHIVLMLIDAGADVSRTRSSSRLGFIDFIYQQRHLHMDTLERMILSDKCTVDLTAVNDDNETLLFQACRDNAVDVVEAMLESSKHLGINICNKFGKSPTTVLCENSEKGQIESVTVLSMLLRNKRAVNLKSADYTGMTPLHIVVENEAMMMANMLLCACQELANTGDAMGRTPLHLAKTAEMVKLLVKRGADIHQRDFLGRTPLLYYVEHGYYEAACALIVFQPDVNAQDNLGRTVLHLGVSSKALDVLKNTRGLQINSENINKQIALHLAVAHSDVEGTEQLLQMGADPSAVDKNQLSPLHLAANMKCRDLLIKHKSRLSVLSRQGDTPDDMKQWHADLEGAKTKELWPEITAHGHDALTKIMKTPFVGFTDANELHLKEQQIILNQLQQVMNILRQEAHQIDPLLRCNVGTVGNFQEGTTVGLPDDVSFVCLLNQVPEMLQPPKKLPYSNTNVALCMKTDFRGDRPNFVDHNGDVMAHVLSHRFSNAIRRALGVPRLWKDFPQLYLTNWTAEPELKLHLIWHGTVYKWLPLSVHIVPGLVFPDWHPSWIETRHADIAKQCFILLKNIAHVEKSKRSVFQIGFAGAEAELLNRMSPQLKAGYQLAKLMRNPRICSPLKTTLQQPASSVISEQMLKTVTFHLHEEMLTSDRLLDAAGVSAVTRAAQLIYERLAAALSQNVLRMYMLPSHNILLDHFQGPRSHEARERARQYCRKISNLLQKNPNPELV